MLHRLKSVVVLLLAFGPVRAAEWKTPDGMVSVTAPDETRFVAVDPPPRALVLWQSQDLMMRMMVGEMPNPQHFKLGQSGLEQGLMKELNAQFRNGKLLVSVVETRNGHEVFTMTARGESEEHTVFMTQSITAVGGKAYVAGVISFGKDTRTDPDATEFIASFKVLAPRAAQTPLPLSCLHSRHQEGKPIPPCESLNSWG